MKRDINLLECLSEGEKKKSSSTGSLIMVVGVLLIVGVMLFMFFSTNMEIKDKEVILKDLDNQLGQVGSIDIIESEIAKQKAKYAEQVEEVLKSINSGQADLSSAVLTDKMFDIIYDKYVNVTRLGNHADGKVKARVRINNISIDKMKTTISFTTRNYQDTWDFVDYLQGNLKKLPEPDLVLDPDAYIATDIEKTAFKEYAPKNATYFNKIEIEDAYPGLPEEGDKGEFKISMTLSFAVNWEALNNETK